MAQVFVGIGSSINRTKNIQLGIIALQTTFGELAISPVYESEAVGFSGGNFYNLVVSFESQLTAKQIINTLKKIELQQGRPEKAIKFAPRTLDLDLLLHDQLIDNSLDIPRAEILRNAFVLQPLADIAPQLEHPTAQKTYRQLWHDFPKDQQKLWSIETLINC
ncbi:2-amino-4-hydroxy-6-hydroxymethyldihydropteridine diphosphokinase [Psychromonas sp. psych-6C06]|uniref:2-amino-4-hydroxy-6- hydroxymethyldihydropteridine diphosphokinase n=1 Tax=Psychromonas sp. psych-6C06 TaxID=2058089 RepID=UPI000C34987E|nr:2-amino-4-hydroxy-6-hydroxymethyldihydropteridine diphosphokinase [Psychromonas sp. psych-6C06]PKF61695.1 2-amino-4-hydroxy-6-hydroxymethyldihydropteridine diphosphokinase [Psychromonas sp. psych-6C06]